jgi:hypothetical protein
VKAAVALPALEGAAMSTTTGRARKTCNRQRRVWRITPAAPLGEIVEVSESCAADSNPSDVEEAADTGWLGSSYDLLNGLEVTETAADDSVETVTDRHGSAAPAGGNSTAPAAISKHQWILRFALKTAELEPHSEPRHVIALARELWLTCDRLAPEETAQDRHRRMR